MPINGKSEAEFTEDFAKAAKKLGRAEAWEEARGVLLGEITRLQKETAKKGPDPKRLAIINRLVSLAKHFKGRE